MVHHGGKFQELSSTVVSELTCGECQKGPEVVNVRKHYFLNVQETKSDSGAQWLLLQSIASKELEELKA